MIIAQFPLIFAPKGSEVDGTRLGVGLHISALDLQVKTTCISGVFGKTVSTRWPYKTLTSSVTRVLVLLTCEVHDQSKAMNKL
jgi:hypothetical protein